METVEIILKGHIDREWSDFMNVISIKKTLEGNTLILGYIKDQAALFGLFNRIRSLGVRILKIEMIAAIDENNMKI